MMNIAQCFIERYESEDFKSSYTDCLMQTFGSNEGDIINRIQELFNISNYETKQYFEHTKYVDNKKAGEIYEYILNNIGDFIRDFNGYYVGYTSLESVAFGQIEEQLTGLYNYKTGRDYNLNYLKKCFENEGFYISGDYTYYNVEGGLHVELCNNLEDIKKIVEL